MASKAPKVIVTRKLPDATETRMMELFDVTLNADDTPFTRDQLKDAVSSADVLVPTLTDNLDDDVLSAAGDNFKLIANFGTGVDHINVKAAQARGITVTNTPGVLTEDTADFTMMLILGVLRRMTEGSRLLHDGEWQGWSPTTLLGHRAAGKRLGIVGMGRIGQAVARRARAFGMSIHYHNRHRVLAETEAELEATYWQSLDQMLARMDIVSVNCPHTPATFHLLSARRLRLMQPHAFLVNAARGEIVDENALTQLLANGRLAGAALDVFEREPAVNAQLLAMDNVVLLPHMGGATLEGRIDMGDKVIINIKTFADGHNPPDRVIEGLI